MTKDDFMKLDDNAKLALLNELAGAGKDLGTICAEIKVPKEELGPKMGFYLVRNKFMKKPMKGYATVQRTGNELEFGVYDGKGKQQ